MIYSSIITSIYEIEHGILSFSYSFHVADSFAGNNECIMDLPFRQYNIGVWVSDIAVIPSEREITISPYLREKV